MRAYASETHLQTSDQGLSVSVNPLNSFAHFAFGNVTISVFIEYSKCLMLRPVCINKRSLKYFYKYTYGLRSRLEIRIEVF